MTKAPDMHMDLTFTPLEKESTPLEWDEARATLTLQLDREDVRGLLHVLVDALAKEEAGGAFTLSHDLHGVVRMSGASSVCGLPTLNRESRSKA